MSLGMKFNRKLYSIFWRHLKTTKHAVESSNRRLHVSPDTPVSRLEITMVMNGSHGYSKSFFIRTNDNLYLFNCGEDTQRVLPEILGVDRAQLNHVFITHNSWSNVGGLVGLMLSLNWINRKRSWVRLQAPNNVGEILKVMKYFSDFDIAANTKLEMASTETFEDAYLKVECMELFPSSGCGASSRVKKSIAYVITVPKVGNTGGPLANRSIMVFECPSVDYLGSLENISKYLDSPPGVVVHMSPVQVVKQQIYSSFVERLCGNQTHHLMMNEDTKFLCRAKTTEKMSQLHQLDADIFPLLRSQNFTPQLTNCTSTEHNSNSSNYFPSQSYYSPNRSDSSPNQSNNSPSRSDHTPNQSDNSPYQSDNSSSRSDCSPNQSDHSPTQSDHSPNQSDHSRTQSDYSSSQSIHTHLHDHSPNFKDADSWMHRKILATSGLMVSLDQGLPNISYRDMVPTMKIGQIANHMLGEDLRVLQVKMEQVYKPMDERDKFPEIVFLGSGAFQHAGDRNVSGTLVQTRKDEYLLLDCGEGTLSQLYQLYGPKVSHILQNLKAVFISHLHYDHHGGLFSLIEARRQLMASQGRHDRLVILSPSNFRKWVSLYSQHVAELYSCIKLIPNHFVDTSQTGRLEKGTATDLRQLKDSLHLKEYTVVPVVHTISSHGLVLTHQDGWKLVYSGDTRPATSLIKYGAGCDVLIHEATFGDEDAELARMAKHSTLSEAISVGQQMNAKFTLLTHFGHRTPVQPTVSVSGADNVGFAVDFMTVCPSTWQRLPLLRPALAALFPQSSQDIGSCDLNDLPIDGYENYLINLYKANVHKNKLVKRT